MSMRPGYLVNTSSNKSKTVINGELVRNADFDSVHLNYEGR
jgi:hypothetical protein